MKFISKVNKFNRILILLILIILISFSVTGCFIRPQIEVTLYFSSSTETEFYLEPEIRKITEDEELYKKVIDELLKGPQSEHLYPTLPSTASVISVEVEGGLATVNFSKEIITDTMTIPHSSTTEILAIYSIVNTLTEFEEIDTVRIIVEGKDSGEVNGMYIEDFWGHVGIYDDFKRNEEIIKNI